MTLSNLRADLNSIEALNNTALFHSSFASFTAVTEDHNVTLRDSKILAHSVIEGSSTLSLNDTSVSIVNTTFGENFAMVDTRGLFVRKTRF